METIERRLLLSGVTFSTPTQYGTDDCDGICIADLNGDGKPDIIAPDSDGTDVNVYLNNGNGTFTPGGSYTAASSVLGADQPYQAVAADFNGDGHIDIATANYSSGTMSVLFGNGTGALSAATVYDAGNTPDGIATFTDPGGLPNIVVSNRGSASVSVFLNQGNGTFAPAVNYSLGASPANVAVGDLNGDGYPDIVTANGAVLNVLLNNGNGTFAAPVTVNDPNGANYVAVADMNGDGYPDLVIGEATGTVQTLLNNGTGTTFGTAATQLNSGSGYSSIAVADFNGDGLPDVVAIDNSTGTYTIYLGVGSGSLITGLTASAGLAGYSVAVGDLNGDGTPDLAIGSYASSPGGFTTLINGGGSTSTGADQLAFATGPTPAAPGSPLGKITVDLDTTQGTLDTTATTNVTLAIDSGPTGATLGGTTTVAAVGGVATFSDITVSAPGTYTLAASAPSDTAAASGAFTIAPVKTIGGLDPTFGSNGQAGHDVGFTSTSGLAIDGEQSVLIGPIGTSPTESFGVTRYNADGTLDTAFGSAGVVSTAFAGTDAVPTALSVLPNGDILVAGTAATFTNGVASSSQFAVAEYNPDGSLNTAFGTAGQLLLGFSAAASSNDVLKALAVAPNGTIYLGGSSDAAGAGNTDFAVAALTAGGGLDTAFAGGGKKLLDIAGGDDAINSLAIQRNGDIVAAGSATVGSQVEVALTRFLTSGTADPHFGAKGIVTDAVGSVYDSASSVAIQTNGAIVIGGLTASGSGATLSSNFLVQRYTTAGRLDRTFGAGGTVTTNFGQPSAITQLVLQSNGEIVASGKTVASLAEVTSSASLGVAIARYSTRGVLDSSFNNTGTTSFTLNGSAVPAALLHIDASTLGAAFDAFASSLQGVVAVISGGEILDAGNSGANTVEAELVAAGVDLVAKLLSSLPASVLGGLKASVNVNITETGTQQATGTVTVTLEIATDAAGNGAETVSKPVTERINLRQGQGRSYRLIFSYPSSLASGPYFLLASAADGSPLSDLNPNNNTVASPAAVNIAPAFVSLAGSALTARASLVPGKVATISVDITNNGNVLAKGRTPLDMYLSTDDTTANGTALPTPTLSLSLPAGKAHLYSFNVKLPTTLTAGTFNLLAQLDPAKNLVDDQTPTTLVIDATQLTVT